MEFGIFEWGDGNPFISTVRTRWERKVQLPDKPNLCSIYLGKTLDAAHPTASILEHMNLVYTTNTNLQGVHNLNQKALYHHTW
jgi:hypothetical protein